MNHCHFCGNNIPDEVDTCAQANYACDGPRTKESNTPDTEWKKEKEEFNKMWNEGKFHWNENQKTEINPQRIWNVFIQPMLTSHTTYWKERVLAIIEEHDPSSDRDANPRYWGKTLREAIKSLR